MPWKNFPGEPDRLEGLRFRVQGMGMVVHDGAVLESSTVYLHAGLDSVRC